MIAYWTYPLCVYNEWTIHRVAFGGGFWWPRYIRQVAQSGILHPWQEIYVPSCFCGRCLHHTVGMISEPLSKGFMFQYNNLQSWDIRNSILKRNCLGCQQHAMIIFWGTNCNHFYLNTKNGKKETICVYGTHPSPPTPSISLPRLANTWGASLLSRAYGWISLIAFLYFFIKL